MDPNTINTIANAVSNKVRTSAANRVNARGGSQRDVKAVVAAVIEQLQ